MNKLCHDLLKVRKEELFALIGVGDEFYKEWAQTKWVDKEKRIPKRDALGRPKTRIIEASTGYLKHVQKRIDVAILLPATEALPEEFKGGRKGVSNIDNARYHASNEALVRYDFQDFFPSISYRQVFKVFRYQLGFNEECANLLTMLTMRETDKLGWHLPQGAPTSTRLSMLVLVPLYYALKPIANEYSLKFSFWIDDTTFSGARVDLSAAYSRLSRVMYSCGFQISADKQSGVLVRGSAFDGKCGRRVTGVNIDDNGNLSLGHQHYRRLTHVVNHGKTKNASIEGQLAYASRISPKYNALRNRYYQDKKAKNGKRGD